MRKARPELAEHQRVADPQPGIVRRQRQQGPLDELVQRLVDQAQRLRLLRIDLAAQHLAQAVHFLAEGVVQFDRRNLHVTDLSRSRVGPSTEMSPMPHTPKLRIRRTNRIFTIQEPTVLRRA